MVLIVDGDNAPGYITRDVSLLKSTDKLYVFYAANNKYYTKKELRDKVEKNSECEVNWMCVPAGNCAADIGAAMMMSTLIDNPESLLYCLISSDKHFGVIKNVAQNMHKDNFIAWECSISDAISKYRILEQTTLHGIHNCFINMYGSKHGSDLYNLMKRLILQNSNTKRIRYNNHKGILQSFYGKMKSTILNL
ncbi:MAG: hypothetical protein KBT27_14490 [Prevotellaceae bacterium]|nr:hypothetical protein [Candidatus Faecinaster equi]